MITPDRAPDGTLLVGQGPAGGVYHAAAEGIAACSLDAPIIAPVPIGRARARRWCQRRACRQHWQNEQRPAPPAASEGAEHVCPVCYVERAADVTPCPNCGARDAAVPEAAIV